MPYRYPRFYMEELVTEYNYCNPNYVSPKVAFEEIKRFEPVDSIARLNEISSRMPGTKYRYKFTYEYDCRDVIMQNASRTFERAQKESERSGTRKVSYIKIYFSQANKHALDRALGFLHNPAIISPSRLSIESDNDLFNLWFNPASVPIAYVHALIGLITRAYMLPIDTIQSSTDFYKALFDMSPSDLFPREASSSNTILFWTCFLTSLGASQALNVGSAIQYSPLLYMSEHFPKYLSEFREFVRSLDWERDMKIRILSNISVPPTLRIYPNQDANLWHIFRLMVTKIVREGETLW